MKVVVFLSILCIAYSIPVKSSKNGRVASMTIARHPPKVLDLIRKGTWDAQEYQKSHGLKKYSQELGDYYDTTYMILIESGTPAQQFHVVMDTGSSDYWLIDYSCKTASCDGKAFRHRKFEASRSKTFQNFGKNVSITYGSGDYMAGYLGYDVVDLAGVKFDKQGFGLATNLTLWEDEPASGILGLAWPNAAYFGETPVMQNLLSQLAEPIFTVYLKSYSSQVQDANGGYLTLGALDTDHCASTVNYVPLSSQVFWQFSISGWSLGSLGGSKSQQVIVDTGTSFIAGPQAVVEQVATAVDATWSDKYGVYLVDCDTHRLPNMTFTISGNQFVVTPKHYVLVWQTIDDIPIQCALGMFPTDGAGWGLSWILGDPFANSYCTVYDIGNAKVGFADKIRE